MQIIDPGEPILTIMCSRSLEVVMAVCDGDGSHDSDIF